MMRIGLIITTLLLGLGLAIPASAGSAPRRAPNVSRLKLKTVPEMVKAYNKIKSLYRKVGKERGPTLKDFRLAVVILHAADLLRKSGNARAAKKLSKHALLRIARQRGAWSYAKLKSVREFSAPLAKAHADAPIGNGLQATEGAWTARLERR